MINFHYMKQKGKNKKKPLIVFIIPGESTFTNTDQKILEEKFTIRKLVVNFQQNLLKNLIKEIYFLLRYSLSCSAFYIWFNDSHALFPAILAKLMKKPVYIVLGGYDVANIPQWNYGLLRRPWKRYLFRLISRLATRLFAVSKFVQKEVLKIDPTLNKEKIKIIYNAVPKTDKKRSFGERKDVILTVGFVNSDQRFYIKGINIFLDVAKLLPEYLFYIIGMDDEYRDKLAFIPSNVTIIPPVSPSELLTYFRKAKIYCQFSIIESFGLAVVEAMANGCFPIVSQNGALPEIVEEHGLIVSINDTELIAKTIKSVCKNYEQIVDEKKLEDYVQKKFAISIRKKKLFMEMKI